MYTSTHVRTYVDTISELFGWRQMEMLRANTGNIVNIIIGCFPIKNITTVLALRYKYRTKKSSKVKKILNWSK